MASSFMSRLCCFPCQFRTPRLVLRVVRTIVRSWILCAVAAAPAPVAAAPAAAPAPAAPKAAEAPAPAAPTVSGVEISAPMSGTVYRRPAPGEPLFVKEGDKVAKGQSICIIEVRMHVSTAFAQSQSSDLQFSSAAVPDTSACVPLMRSSNCTYIQRLGDCMFGAT